MDKQYLETEFNTFFEFDSDDRSVVTSTSAKMFAEHMALPIESLAEQLRAELAALRAAVRPFVRLVKDTSGRIPTERLSFADWHALAKVGAGDTADLRPNSKVRGPEAAVSPEAPSRLAGCAAGGNYEGENDE